MNATSFTGNTASFGGGALLDGRNTSRTALLSCSFSGNTASGGVGEGAAPHFGKAFRLVCGYLFTGFLRFPHTVHTLCCSGSCAPTERFDRQWRMLAQAKFFACCDTRFLSAFIGGGGGLQVGDGLLLLALSSFVNNSAAGSGGGLLLSPTCNSTVC